MKVPIAAIVLMGLAGCERKQAPALSNTQAEKPHAAAAAPVTSSGANTQRNGLVVVQERNQVCMVNDQYMGREQIPVTISDKTYYGCCPMCKGRLERDPTARAAKDPVTGSPVDKATAIIGRAPSGQVFYFENEDSLRQYRL